MVIASKASYNLLIGREWIHGIWVMPSSLHQGVAIWRNNGIVENIKDEQGYFIVEVNHVDRRNFDKNSANFAFCSPARFACL